MNSMVVSSCSLSPPPCCFFLSACKRKLSSVFLFLFPLEEEEKKEEEEESNLLLVVVAVVILFFDVATSPVSSTVADVRIDIVRNEDSDARVRTEEVTEDDDEEAKFRRSFSTSSPRGIRRRILCEDDKSFDAPLKLTDAAFLRIFFDAPVFCTRQALVCAHLDDVGQDEDMICFFVLTHKSYGSDLSVVSRFRFLLCFNCYYYYYYPPLFSLRTSRRKGKE